MHNCLRLSNPRRKRRSSHFALLCGFVTSLGLVLLLTACGSIEQDVTFYSNERWKAETSVGLSSEQIVMAGGPAKIETVLKEEQASAEAAGANYRWKREKGDDGNLYYVVNASGEGYGLLNQLVFDGDASIDSVLFEDQEAVRFNAVSSSESRARCLEERE